MLILYVGMKFDYGKQERGFSFEHYNFYETLVRMGHDVIYFDYATLLRRYGRRAMNNLLLRIAAERRPDLLFCFLHVNELRMKTIREISEKTEAVTMNWFADDHWRFEDFSSRWAPNFDYVITTAKDALRKYKRAGYENAIPSQWACNQFLYRKVDLPHVHDLSFVGQPHGERRRMIRSLQEAGLDVTAWGRGWKNGRVSQEEMIRIFNQTRINLNFSYASIAPSTSYGKRAFLKLAPAVDEVSPYLTLRMLEIFEKKSRAPDKPRLLAAQIKGRNFEIPGCGGFVLTEEVEGLNEYYVNGKEVVSFRDSEELVSKAHYYLTHEDERVSIANAGYERTLKEHTYVHRFTEIFRRIGLETQAPEKILDEGVSPGKTVWIS